MSTVAGDLPHFEALSRALFAGDLPEVARLVEDWPSEVAQHLRAPSAEIEATAPTN